MRRITLSLLTVSALVAFGCGGDDDAGAGGTSGSGGTGGASGTGGTTEPCTGAATDDPNCINAACGEAEPISGDHAAKGICCFRASNFDRAKAAWAAGETATLEYRQNALKTSSQPGSVGNPLIQASLADSYKNEWSTTLVRIAGVPETGSATVTLTIGAGRPNCDGTFSFFGAGAAPDREGRADADRWTAQTLQGTWDWDAAPADRLVVTESTRPAGVNWSPVGKDYGEFGYEQPTMDLDYDFTFPAASSADVTPDDLNCSGGSLSGTTWTSTLAQTVFFPVAELKTAFVNSLTLQQNFCGFMALGYMSMLDMDGMGCVNVPQVDWVEKPVGVCGADHCYVGDAAHPDANCGGTTGNDCCDPDGASTTLEPCNAFLIEATAVLGGAEITDAPHTDADEVYPNCTI